VLNVKNEVLHRGRKEFVENPKHLIVVPQYPKQMKLRLSEDDIRIGEKSYSLIGTTLHYGEIFYVGHYISLVKDGNKWYECNDSHVQEIYKHSNNHHAYYNQIGILNFGPSQSGYRSPFSRYENYTPTLLVYEMKSQEDRVNNY